MEKEETDKFKNNKNETDVEPNLDEVNEGSDSKEANKKPELTLEEEIEVLKDKIARTYAEMENQRRRFEKEKDEAFEYGGFGFAKESLNLLDNLERSKLSLENDDSLTNTEALKKIIDHINIINKDMLTIFKKNNIETIKAIDKKLDPNLHQAMMEIEDETKEPGTIVKEIQKGFMMKDRLLRPSLVAVSKLREKNVEKSEENQEKKGEN